MRCERCKGTAVFFAHDAAAEAHAWSEEREDACECGVEVVCAACEADRIRRDGAILLARAPGLSRAVASPRQLRH